MQTVFCQWNFESKLQTANILEGPVKILGRDENRKQHKVFRPAWRTDVRTSETGAAY